MKLRIPASRDVRRVLESLLFWTGLIGALAAPWLLEHAGVIEATHDLADFLISVRTYR